LAFRLDISIRQNDFNLTIWQFDSTIRQFGLANKFAKWTKIVAPVFWQKAGKQLWFQEVWWRARDCLLWHSTQKNGISPQKGGKVRQDTEAGLFQVHWPLELSVLLPERDHIVQNNKKVISAGATFGLKPMAMAERAKEGAQYQVSAKMWEASVKMNCWRNNFKLIHQFIVDDDVEMLVCKQINIPEQYAERFWQERGKKVARMAINRRRQNT
jgi:hypothetical protein